MDRPRVQFGGQTEEQAGANLALADLIHARRDDPGLNTWEKGFLADIEDLLRSQCPSGIIFFVFRVF